MIRCAEAVKQLWEYLEEDLEESDRERVEEHLAFCRRCCGELEFADELRQFMTSSTQAELPEPIEERLVTFIDELETGSSK